MFVSFDGVLKDQVTGVCREQIMQWGYWLPQQLILG